MKTIIKEFLAGLISSIFDLLFIFIPGFSIYKGILKIINSYNIFDKIIYIIIIILLCFYLFIMLSAKGIIQSNGDDDK